MTAHVNKIRRGFTLVELLIVIALLGVLAVAVIATINPVEQANRARDTKYNSDASQLVSAIERYFAANNKYPWVAKITTLTNDSAYGYANAKKTGVGICYTAAAAAADADGACDPGDANDGELISSLEIKREFEGRDFLVGTAGTTLFSGTNPTESLYIGKADSGTATGSTSVYACFVPLSKKFRSEALAKTQAYTLNATGGRVAATPACTTTWTTTGASTCYVCVPR